MPKSPFRVTALVGLLARRGAVAVALELPVDEQPVMQAYLASSDERAARTRLLAAPHRSWANQDGRGSQAMLALLYASGSAWVCRTNDECGPDPMRGRDRDPSAFVAPSSERAGYDGILHVGAIEASPPALPGAGGPAQPAATSSSHARRAWTGRTFLR